jgi:hypothetical protein
MWCVKMTKPKEVHVYPLVDRVAHLLSAELCRCWPEVRHVDGAVMIVHKWMGQPPVKLIYQAHWIH